MQSIVNTIMSDTLWRRVMALFSDERNTSGMLQTKKK
jgi:hypothetical protein